MKVDADRRLKTTVLNDSTEIIVERDSAVSGY